MSGRNVDRPLSVEGLPVSSVVDAPARPVVNHGRLAITAPPGADPKASVSAVDVIAGEDRWSVDEFYVYALPDYIEMDPGRLEVPSGRRTEYEVSFGGQPAAPGDAPVVEIEVAVAGAVHRARSKVTLTVRTRSRQRPGSPGSG